MAASDAPSFSDSLKEYGRGFAGGLLFSLPLLYTMEVWWSGFLSEPRRLLLLLAFTFVLLLGYNRFAGLREDASWSEIVIDSVEELGLGIVTSAAVLYVIGQIDASAGLQEVIGKILIEGAVVAIGFSVGTAQLGAGGDDDSGKRGEQWSETQKFSSSLVITLCGAVLFAANVAPTEEIVVIGLETAVWKLVFVALFSLLLGTGILFFIDFTGSETAIHVEGKLDIVLGGVITYAIALITSAAILWFFGRFDGAATEVIVRESVVLAFPAVLGASAGRLLLET